MTVDDNGLSDEVIAVLTPEPPAEPDGPDPDDAETVMDSDGGDTP